MQRLSGVVTLVMLGLVITGCGPSGPTMRTISGTVTYDGQPVSNGQIIFRATDAGGVGDAGPIKDGKYEAKVRGGPKTVEITAQRETGKKDSLGGAEVEQFIPENYNTKTELKADISDDNSALNFDLKK